jgi:predicted acetyltransferase
MLRRPTPADWPGLEQLWQLYMHDLSGLRGTMPGPDGRFHTRRLEPYRDESDADRRAYLIEQGGPPVGFAFVSRLTERPMLMSEFFVVRAVRRSGVGRAAAVEVLARHPGQWEIPFQEGNTGAARFWRQVAADVAGDSWREDRRPVPGKPHIPTDVWITLEIAPQVSRRPTQSIAQNGSE